MTAPRLEIHLGRIQDNASKLVDMMGERGIAVTGVTKAGLGSTEVADAMLRGGVRGLGDSRIENIEAMNAAGVSAPMTLIRSPMMSQVDRVVQHADVSFNTEMDVIKMLSHSARSSGRMHRIVLMVELGDLREGIMPSDVEGIVRKILHLPNIELAGIGTNLACRSGVVPDTENMGELSSLVNTIEATFGLKLDIVSGGNSANLQWIINSKNPGRINDLRLGESILLGREPLYREPIPDMHTNAFTLFAEVIESKLKPSLPKGTLAQTAFGEQQVATDQGTVAQSILALGRQDIDLNGLHAPPGIEVLDASSDHLIIASAQCLRIGSAVTFQLDYSALLRAMTSPFVSKMMVNRTISSATIEKKRVAAA